MICVGPEECMFFRNHSLVHQSFPMSDASAEKFSERANEAAGGETEKLSRRT